HTGHRGRPAVPSAPRDGRAGGGDTRPARRAPRRRGDAGHGPVTASHLRQLASVVGLLVLWQLLVQTGKLSELFLPAPLSVLASMWAMPGWGRLPGVVLWSLIRVVHGFVYGATAGIVLGLLAGAVGWIEDVLDPWVAAVYPIPKSALFPLFLLWFGLGDASKIATIAIGVLF